MKKILVVAIALIATASLSSCGSSSASTPTESKKANEIKPVESKVDLHQWSYDTTENEMGDKIVQISVQAKDLVELDFPYNGGSQADLTVRKKNKQTDVIFYIDKGQIDTDYDGTYVRVKFDDAEPTKWLVNESASGSSNIVFIDNQKAFITKLKTSKKVVMEVPFYQNGNQQFVFNTENLKY